MEIVITSLIKKVRPTSYSNPSLSSIGKVIITLPILLSFNAIAIAVNELDSLTDVNDIYQDSKGYMWISGQHGITRFDGKNQIDFSANSINWPLPFSWVHQITPFKNELIVSTQIHGIYLFNTENGQSQQLELPNYISATYFSTYFQTHIYFESNDDLYQYNIETSTTKLIRKNLFINGIRKTKDNLYFITDNEVYILKNNDIESIYKGDIDLFTTTTNHLIFKSANTLYSVSEDTIDTSTPFPNAAAGITCANNGESVFIFTFEGKIHQFNAKSLADIQHNFPDISTSKLKKAYQDKSGLLWLASSNGIKRVSESHFINHPKVFNVKHNANELTYVKDKLAVATYGDGIHIMTNTNTYVASEANHYFTDGAKKILTVLHHNEQILLGTFDGLWSYKPNTKNTNKVDFDGNDNIVLKLVSKGDKIYIGTNRAGLKIYDSVENKVTYTVDNTNGLKNTEVIDILPLANGEVWLATSNNVEIYNSSTKKVKQTNINIPNKVISLFNINNRIYAFTKGSGVLIFSLKGELLTVISEGLDFGYGSVIDEEIWVASKSGLYRFQPESMQMSLIPGSENYSFGSSPLRRDNKIYAWHSRGLFEVKHSDSNKFNSNVKVSMVNISGKKYLNDSTLELSSQNEVLTLQLASLDYRLGTEKKFQYQINNSVWNQISGNQITLTGLTSGKYEIEIKGTNSLGQWSANRAYATISVAYPWYWTLQMRIIYVIALVCTIAITIWLFYLRANSISKVHHLLENELKNKGKRSVSINRSLNLVQELLEHNNIDDAKKIIQQSIDELESNNINNEPDSLYGNSLSVALPFFGEYLHRKYHISLNCQLEYNEEQLDYEFQASIYKIVYEAITSALLNTESRNFHVQIQEFKSKLWLTITDDENCFSHFNSVITFNMAMYYVRQIADKYNASVNTFDAQDDKGSQLIVSFPLMSLT